MKALSPVDPAAWIIQPEAILTGASTESAFGG
jgi:hypothetical protein